MANEIIKTQLHPQKPADETDIIYPETSIDQVKGLPSNPSTDKQVVAVNNEGYSLLPYNAPTKVAVGETQTLPAGYRASVQNVGTPEAPVLQFQIPQGQQGIQGRKGDTGETGAIGERGAAGAVFTPSVSDEGVISWTNDGGLPNPEPADIRGPRGPVGPVGPSPRIYTHHIKITGSNMSGDEFEAYFDIINISSEPIYTNTLNKGNVGVSGYYRSGSVAPIYLLNIIKSSYGDLTSIYVYTLTNVGTPIEFYGDAVSIEDTVV